MNLKSVFSFLVLHVIGLLVLQAQTLPKDSLQGFSIKDSVTVYRGDDLFFLIDGGAEVYLEYGFAQVMAADYSKNGQQVHVELYEMNSIDAAYGIYSLRKPVNNNHNQEWIATAYSKDYMMAYSDKHYLVVSGINDSVLLNKMASTILPDLHKESYTPLVIRNIGPNQYARIIYVKGPIALSNVHQFGYGMLADFTEAIAIVSKESLRVLIQYNDSAQAITSFKDFGTKARTLERYQLKTENKNMLEFSNNKNNLIRITKPVGNCFEIYVLNL